MAKKSYKGFIIWMVVFLAVMFAPAFLPIEDENLVTRLVLALCGLSIAALAFMTFVNCRVYWYNGVTYEDAVAAGAERCKVYAFRHFVRFGIFAVAYIAFSAILHLLQIGIWIDIVVFCVGLIAVAVSTVKIKL